MFKEGHIDETFIHHNVKDKRHIFGEITKLKKALKPFIHLIGDHAPEQFTIFTTMATVIELKSKPYYKHLIDKKVE